MFPLLDFGKCTNFASTKQHKRTPQQDNKEVDTERASISIGAQVKDCITQQRKGNVMKEKVKNMSVMRKMFHYMTNVIREYNIGRVNCLA